MSYYNENVTKQFIDRPIILVPAMAGRIAFIDGCSHFLAGASMEAFQSDYGREFLLPKYQMMVADPEEDPMQRECVIYGTDDGVRTYLGSKDGTSLVTGTSSSLCDADRYSIINVDAERRLCYIYSKQHGKYLSVDLTKNYDPDGEAYAVRADKTEPDEYCVFAYCN